MTELNPGPSRPMEWRCLAILGKAYAVLVESDLYGDIVSAKKRSTKEVESLKCSIRNSVNGLSLYASQMTPWFSYSMTKRKTFITARFDRRSMLESENATSSLLVGIRMSVAFSDTSIDLRSK